MIHLQEKFTQKLAKDKNQQKFRNHSHFTGKYSGAAHSICNLRFNVVISFYHESITKRV